MRPPLSYRLGLVTSAVVFVLALRPAPMAAPQGAAAPQPPPTYRGGVTAVPIDVRVVDRAGRPVTDLRPDDFTLFEDDVRQAIVHFSLHVLEALAPGPGLRARPDVPAFAPAAPQDHRVFLIVLGAGALGARPLATASPSGSVHGANTAVLPDPSRALDGLVHLLRDRLLPQDQVALLAYNRASDFTADHEAMATLLESFRRSEEAGLAALAKQGVAAAVRTPPDTVFQAPELGPNSMQTAELGFAEYVDARNRRTGDAENIYYGLKYLRYVEGEKHLIYVTANGIIPPVPGSLESSRRAAWDDPKHLAAAASDARVAVHVIQTAGLSASPGEFLRPLPVMTPSILSPGQAYFGSGGSGATPAQEDRSGAPRAGLPQPGWDRPAPAPGVRIPGLNATTMEALADLRELAAQTGGTASILSYATQAVDRLDAHTRVGYLLAYYPSHGTMDGRYRNVRVEVNRPDVSVSYRHGYYGREQAASMTRRAVVTDARLASAATSTREITEVALAVTPVFTKGDSDTGGELLVKMVIDGSRLGWASDELSRRVAHLDVAVFCADAGRKIVGRTSRTLDITLTERRFAQLATQGLPYSVRIPLKAPARFVKVIVYNYDANLLGSTTVRMK